MMPSAHKTMWSLVPLATTVGGGLVAFFVWRDLWAAVVVGMLAGSLVTGVRTLSELTWMGALTWVSSMAAAIAAGWLSYAAWRDLWIALLVAVLLGALAGMTVRVVAWLVKPTPVDLDAILGGPDDVFWRLRDTRVWRRFAAWVERHARDEARDSRTAP